MLSPEEYREKMNRSDFVIQQGYVVCKLCRANCGQCGIGVHQARCQEYYDAQPKDFDGLGKQWTACTRTRWQRAVIALVVTIVVAACFYRVL